MTTDRLSTDERRELEGYLSVSFLRLVTALYKYDRVSDEVRDELLEAIFMYTYELEDEISKESSANRTDNNDNR